MILSTKVFLPPKAKGQRPKATKRGKRIREGLELRAVSTLMSNDLISYLHDSKFLHVFKTLW